MEYTYYPLSSSQRMLDSARIEFGSAQALTIGVSIAVKFPVDIPVLKACLLEEIRRLQCLRLHFSPPDKEGIVRQYIVPELNPQIPYLDLSKMKPEDIKDMMTDWSTQGFEDWDHPLFRLSLTALPHGWNGIYLCIDHRIMDSSGLIAMMNDTLELYCHRCFHTPMPAAPGSYETALQMDLKNEADQEALKKDMAFWEEQLSIGEPIYTDITGPWKLQESRMIHNAPQLRAADRIILPSDGDMETFVLPPESALLFSNYCRKNAVSLTNLILMGMRTCLSKANEGESDICLKNYVSRRSLKMNRTCGGCRIHAYPCRTQIDPDTSFLDGIKKIQNIQYGIYRHCNFDPALLYQMMDKAYATPAGSTYEGAAVTCQPIPLSPANPFFKHIPVKVSWFSSKADIQKLYLTVMGQPYKKDLSFYFKYQTAELQKEDLQLFYETLIHALSLGISQNTITIGKLLSQI